MRLDKFLKLSRIIKRRTVAHDAAENERVLVNNNIAKPGKDIKVGDIITIEYYKRKLVIEVLDINEKVKAQDSDKLYKIIEMKEE